MSAPSTDARSKSWFDVTRVATDPRPELDFVAEADVCVIGAGVAGLHVALEIARKGWSVVVLEARTIGAGASGCNTGLVHDGYDCPVEKLEAAVGLSRSKALWKLSRDGARAVRDLIDSTRMPGVGVEWGGLQVTRLADPVAFRNRTERMTSVYGATGLFWNVDRLHGVLRSPLYTAGVFDSTAFSLHPLNYCLGVANQALKAGARIYENAQALAIDLSSIRRSVATAKGAVRCDHVVIAGSALLAPFFPTVSRTLSPVTVAAAVTEPLGDRLESVMLDRHGVWEHRHLPAQFRLVGGDRLLWSGEPRIGIHRAAYHEAALRASMTKAFPSLSGIGFDHVWTGVNAHTRHSMPQVGQIAPAVWVSVGFGRQGINTAAVCGLMIARAIVEKNETVRLFEPFLSRKTFGSIARLRQRFDLWRSARRDRADERAAR